ncbi:ATP synthase subunit a 2-like [Mangifera indica]|uniref:ATP synthase subunit a 2-like n=1 Tax=Mangifera indica TaxID=29780 RepID=UPI001CFC2DD8|nr:ATP synthase subunit a 2-like [Mangifera indica]
MMSEVIKEFLWLLKGNEKTLSSFLDRLLRLLYSYVFLILPWYVFLIFETLESHKSLGVASEFSYSWKGVSVKPVWPPTPQNAADVADQVVPHSPQAGEVAANSPLDQFEIIPFLPMNMGDFYFSFTNSSFFMLLTLSLVLLLVYLVTKKGGGNLVPNAWQSLVELIYDFVLNLVNEQIGGLSGNVKQKFFPCIFVTLTFLLFCNLQGMIPYSFTVTSHFLITLGLSFSIWIGITIVGFVILQMEGTSKKKCLSSSKNIQASGNGGSDDDDDRNKRRLQEVVSNEIHTTLVGLIRNLIKEVIGRPENTHLREGILNPNSNRWNWAVKTALEELVGDDPASRSWQTIAHLLRMGLEISTQAGRSPFLLRVLLFLTLEYHKRQC